MPVNFPEPEHWGRFVSLFRQHLPRFPVVPETLRQQRQQSADRAINLLNAFMDGMQRELPRSLSLLLQLNNFSSNAFGALLSAGENMAAKALYGGDGSLIVGGGIATVEAGYQNLQRNDETLVYFLQLTGMVTTLARCCVGAVRDDLRYVSMPEPRVPGHIASSGDLSTDYRRSAFLRGYESIRNLIAQIDTTRPIEGDYYSKRCLIHIVLLTGMTGENSDDDQILRRRCEEIIFRDFVGSDLRQQREQLRRWAASA